MGAAHLPAHRHIEALPQAVSIGFVRRQPDRFDVDRRPIAPQRQRTSHLDRRHVRRREPEDVPIHRRRVVGVIEHQEVGELLLVQPARHVGEREQPLRHGGEGDEALTPMPHDDREPEMIPRQRQSPPTRIPDRDREWAMKLRPEIVAEPLPGRQRANRAKPPHRRAVRREERARPRGCRASDRP